MKRSNIVRIALEKSIREFKDREEIKPFDRVVNNSQKDQTAY